MSEADLKSEPKAENMSEMAENFKKGVLIIAMLLLFVATFQLYFSIEKIIDTWFQYQYASIFKAVYYLFVLVVSLYIILVLLTKHS